jgi:hypothetical protein
MLSFRAILEIGDQMSQLARNCPYINTGTLHSGKPEKSEANWDDWLPYLKDTCGR